MSWLSVYIGPQEKRKKSMASYPLHLLSEYLKKKDKKRKGSDTEGELVLVMYLTWW